ncbi:MAG: acyltransferase [Eubacteriales bacterium]|nr:acyltransferase [Eubacteriales bacterium]
MRENLRSFRDELKGLAILWVVFFHAQLGLQGPLRGFQQLGYGGVDLFFFMTGFGLYHSLSKDSDLGRYWSRRILRLVPAFLPLCVLWLALMLPTLRLSLVPAVQTVLGNLLMIGYWAQAPQMMNWYLSGLIMVILLAPILFACLNRAKNPQGAALGMICLSVLAGVCFAFDERLIMVARLPVFVLGMWFAMPRRQEIRQPAAKAAAYVAAFALGAVSLFLCMGKAPSALMDYGMYWYPFALMIPPACAALTWCLRKLEKAAKLFAPLRYLGKASFEIFLLNSGMEVYLKKGIGCENTAVWLSGSLGCLLVGMAYHWLVEKGMRRA